jgi:anthranilate phosphoribosyltransferase
VQEHLQTLLEGRSLDERQAEDIFESLLAGRLEEAAIGGLLSLIQTRGATAPELTGAATAMRRHVERVPYEPPEGVRILDTCGTGGAPKTYNVSTAAAIIAAAAGFNGGLRVAKHGNRSRTGRGSAEILDRLGVNLDASPESQARCLEEAGVCFCFAMRHHPAMRHAAGPRKALGFPTIFNLLGPLTNPAGAAHQLLGVYDRDAVRPMAEALAALGTKRAIVAHGLDGLDEMTTTTGTLLCEVEDGVVIEREAVAEDFGLERATLEDLQAGDLDEAERAIRDVLAGERGPKLDLALWNAAGALAAGEIAEDLAEGLDLARDAVESGAAERTLERLAAVSREG